jgi:hypothetical protein
VLFLLLFWFDSLWTFAWTNIMFVDEDEDTSSQNYMHNNLTGKQDIQVMTMF